MSSHVKLVTNNEEAVDPSRPIILNLGEYELTYVGHKISCLFGKSVKLNIEFKIVTEGKCFGKKIVKYYNVKSTDKKKRIIPTGWHSDYAREYMVLFGEPNTLRDFRICSFKNKIIWATVRTVTSDSKQGKLPETLQYSVVDKLIKVAVGK